MLGYNDLKTTIKYMNAAQKSLKNVKSPLDNFCCDYGKGKNKDID